MIIIAIFQLFPDNSTLSSSPNASDQIHRGENNAKERWSNWNPEESNLTPMGKSLPCYPLDHPLPQPFELWSISASDCVNSGMGWGALTERVGRRQTHFGLLTDWSGPLSDLPLWFLWKCLFYGCRLLKSTGPRGISAMWDRDMCPSGCNGLRKKCLKSLWDNCVILARVMQYGYFVLPETCDMDIL